MRKLLLLLIAGCGGTADVIGAGPEPGAESAAPSPQPVTPAPAPHPAGISAAAAGTDSELAPHATTPPGMTEDPVITAIESPVGTALAHFEVGQVIGIRGARFQEPLLVTFSVGGQSVGAWSVYSDGRDPYEHTFAGIPTIPGAAGDTPVDVRIVTPSGKSNVVTITIGPATGELPIIDGFSANAVFVEGTITVYGRNLSGDAANETIEIDGTAAPILAASATQAVIEVPNMSDLGLPSGSAKLARVYVTTRDPVDGHTIGCTVSQSYFTVFR